MNRSRAIAATLILALAVPLSAVPGAPARAQIEGSCQQTAAPTVPATGFPGPFHVYFDKGEASLRPDAQKKIAEVAARAKDLYVNRICIAGFAAPGDAEKVGGAKDGEAKKEAETLPHRRAMAVAEALKAEGIPGKSLIIEQDAAAVADTEGEPVKPEEREQRATLTFAN